MRPLGLQRLSAEDKYGPCQIIEIRSTWLPWCKNTTWISNEFYVPSEKRNPITQRILNYLHSSSLELEGYCGPLKERKAVLGEMR